VEFEAVVDGGVRVGGPDGPAVVAADSVIVATPLAADESVAEMLRADGHDPVVIGDCTGVGYIEGAMSDGFRAGLAVG
jgi:predicted dinucleotide-binding enzyme